MTNAQTLRSIITTKVLVLVNPIIGIVTGLAVIFFIGGLAKFILNAGDEKGREEGKKVMLWGIIALFVIVSMWGIVRILQRSIFDRYLPSPAPFSEAPLAPQLVVNKGIL